VNPPTEEPHRSIYADILSLPDPTKLGTTVRIFNYDSVTLYMRVDGSATGWTFTSNDLGALTAGADFYRNLDRFGERAKPAAAVTETITVRLRAYTDAGYTVLKWTFTRTISVVFIKSDDGSWTQDYLDNFDDGTVQGWAGAAETGGSFSIAASTTYALSPSYSLKGEQDQNTTGGSLTNRLRIYKTINTPNRTTVLAIANIRCSCSAGIACALKYVYPANITVAIQYIGRPFVADGVEYFPKDRWMRLVMLLPKNTAVDFRIYLSGWANSPAAHSFLTIYMDDFTVISKA